LAGGVLADVYGKRRVLSISGLAFGIASGACAFAPSVSWLVLVRVLQRIAARNPCADKPRLHRCNLFRRRTQAVDRSLGLGVGICGCLSEQLGWQWVFSINPPLGLIAIGQDEAIAAARRAIARWLERQTKLLIISAALCLAALPVIAAVPPIPSRGVG
jgi:MFS family permease